MSLEDLDAKLQYGPAMRVQRVTEAGFLALAFFSGDARFAWVTFCLTLLQGISARLVPVALLVAVLTPARRAHALGDLYFDLAGTRGACAISAVVQAGGLWLVHTGHTASGMMVLAIPAASFLLAPTVGFCCGCACYVIARDGLARLGVLERLQDGSIDVDVEPTTTGR